MTSPKTTEPRFFLGVAAGQLIAFIAACGGTAVELLGDASRPFFMATCCYALLALFHGGYLFHKHGFRLASSWWKYALLALVDVVAAVCTLASLSFTSVTSWALIQPASLLTVVPLSVILLKASYSLRHLCSGLLAFAGLVLLLLSDVSGENCDSGRSAAVTLFGDFVALLGTCLYGLNSTLVETVLKGSVPQYEVLGMMGLFGTLYGAIASLALGEVSSKMFPTDVAVLYTAIAVGANFGFYALGVVVLQNAGAAVLVISLLGVNFWSVLGKIFIVGGFHTDLIGFIFAVIMVITGVTLFTLSGDPYAKRATGYVALESELAQGTAQTASCAV